MQIKIEGRNLKLTDGIEDYAQKKLGKLERYLPSIREVLLELSEQDSKRGEDLTIAQLTVMHRRGAILRTEEQVGGKGHDARVSAINAAMDKMGRRIDRFKGKRMDRGKKRGRFAATMEELTAAEEVPAEELAESSEELEWVEAAQPEIVRRKQVEMAPMSEDEAIEQMELLGHTFFMFMDASSNKVSVLYKRSDGSYGVLIPQ
jgi:putative sigma-54 modulation protein